MFFGGELLTLAASWKLCTLEWQGTSKRLFLSLPGGLKNGSVKWKSLRPFDPDPPNVALEEKKEGRKENNNNNPPGFLTLDISISLAQSSPRLLTA